jgi:hypothetical protein
LRCSQKEDGGRSRLKSGRNSKRRGVESVNPIDKLSVTEKSTFHL